MALVIGFAAVPAAASVRPARAASSRQPIRAPGRRPFVPRTGDWEGAANGFPASFQLSYAPQWASLPGLVPYGFEDLVLVEPGRCPVAPWSFSENVTGAHDITPMHAGGSFGLGSRVGVHGGLTGSRSAKVSISFDLPSSPGFKGCRGTLIWRMHPARRRAVHDGTWRLHFGDGESETFAVGADGRLATGIALPRAVASCGGPTGGIDLFIPANAKASYNEPNTLAAALDFSDRTASGAFTVPGGSCANPRVAMTASLQTSSR